MATTDHPLTNNSTTTGPQGSGVKQRVSEMTDRVRTTAADFGRTAADNIDRNLDTAAGALQNAADTLRSKAGAGEGRTTQIANTTASTLETTARYFREHHTREMVESLETVIRRKPAVSLGVALGVGFLIGMTMRKDRHHY